MLQMTYARWPITCGSRPSWRRWRIERKELSGPRPISLTGKVEFRVLDLDEANEVIGSRIYAVEPAMAATWLKSMLGAAAPKLPFDQLIEIRESLSDCIQSRISGDAPVEQPNSFIMNCLRRHS